MDPFQTRAVGSRGIRLPALGFGGVGIGELFRLIDEPAAVETLDAAWTGGIRYFDTSPFYGRGLSELRIGRMLYGKDLESAVISTKVGRVFRSPPDPARLDRSPWFGGLAFDFRFDYSYDGVMRSYEDSLLRLGVPRVDMLVIHDLDHWFHRTDFRVDAYLAQLSTSGWRALEELRDGGLISAIGAGINGASMIGRFLDAVDLDFVLLAMRYTLMEQDTLDAELPLCEERGVSIVVGSPFSSGITATGPIPGAKYNYADPTPEIVDRVRRIEAVCTRNEVPLAAAALQFPLGHPAVASVIPGADTASHVLRNIDLMRHPIPTGLWDELKAQGLIRVDAPTPKGRNDGGAS